MANEVSLLEAVVLGTVQGLTEFLPISSSAHLRVVPAALGWHDPGAAYSAVLQLGSVLAVITYFFKQLVEIATGSIKAVKDKDFESVDFKIAAGIIIGTIPICVIGLAIKKLLESPDSPIRSLMVVGVVSIIMGLMLLVAEKFGSQKKVLNEMGIKEGLLVGLGQALALIPGCSRSGSTLTVAMLLGLNRADAARFSFLLGIPAIVLSGLLELKELIEIGFQQSDVVNLACGLLVSWLVSWASIAWLIRFLQKHSTWGFVVYRVLFGSYVIYLATRGG
ncbi:undecaprenyl-diphosphate phosphatase [Candidatus Obscuribacterales bacterium]|nr:undecaprenyl-diphosphate phosphatase [Candidatus Obscuribacterales bacterium]MBX3138602.1 undecaprenyl-diphosphate phosphatase [Candidatus Obscuribacterales bacterium]MBX3153678.1 undecaprenyl-diphosphate phosphatase [Candidatus Obscuribacterales bacterium]